VLLISIKCTIVHRSQLARPPLPGTLQAMHDRAGKPIAWGARVRSRRMDLGLRQDELAALAGVSVRFVHTLEQGKPTLRLDKVLAVLAQLGLDLVLEPGSGAIRYGDG
jgi:HTH-type transcriptional regulator/antitoxin HipB